MKKSKNALDFVDSLPAGEWVRCRSSAQGILDLVSEKNRRGGQRIVVRVTPDVKRAGWVKVMRIRG
tara:strand:- start:287 stop:484 length:198 start_codon:yes stop_codon:yes gene_type:complete